MSELCELVEDAVEISHHLIGRRAGGLGVGQLPECFKRRFRRRLVTFRTNFSPMRTWMILIFYLSNIYWSYKIYTFNLRRWVRESSHFVTRWRSLWWTGHERAGSMRNRWEKQSVFDRQEGHFQLNISLAKRWGDLHLWQIYHRQYDESDWGCYGALAPEHLHNF